MSNSKELQSFEVFVILLTFLPSTTSDKLLDRREKAWVGSGYMGSFSPGAAANMMALEGGAMFIYNSYIQKWVQRPKPLVLSLYNC